MEKANKKYFIALFIITVGLIGLWPQDELFDAPISLVVESEEGQLLGAKIASDGQWRFPTTDSLPDKYIEALLAFEDKRFRSHLGIDFLALARATKLNLSAGKIVSGGSTITMQVVRLSRRNPSRTFSEKFLELFRAFRTELRYSKDEILRLYASNAPFGGNIVGIETASWRYFGLNPHQLTWAECATLAVLPNSPGLIHPGRNRSDLRKKRNSLLKRLHANGTIDQETYELSLDEELPESPKPFPKLAPHLLNRIHIEKPSKKKVKTTVSYKLQRQTNQLVAKHHKRLVTNQVHNLSVLVVETKTGKVKAYVGNHHDLSDKTNGYQVDVITSPRSTGSILKPFLYAAMLSEGELLPNSLVPDIPTYIGSFAPKNYNLGYDGAVPANRALARSLNIPAVRMLMDYSVPKFYDLLKKGGITTLNNPSSHYGLSLILGGAEGSLWDITGLYASMGRSLENFQTFNAKYSHDDYHAPYFIDKKNRAKAENLTETSVFSAAGIWFAFNAMLDVERPGADNNWRSFSSSKKIAWKTGTSFGFRDAWAVGVTPDYTVGVWVGNADGEGRPGIVGVRSAAPVLFDVFDILPAHQAWFSEPYDDIQQLKICTKSGFLAGINCEEYELKPVPSVAERSDVCPFHRMVHLDTTERFQVSSACAKPAEMMHKKWFVLPPMQEWFFKFKNANYRTLPPMKEGCQMENKRTMQLIYPQHNTQVFLPRSLQGEKQQTVFEAAHRNSAASVFWYVDDEFVGETKHFHQIALSPPKGKHVLTITDTDGNTNTILFDVIDKDDDKGLKSKRRP